MEQEKRFLSVKDVQNIFNLSRYQATELIKTEGFPAIRIGRTYRIDAKGLEEWIANNIGKDIPKNKND